jgi:hypothetical protein
LRAVLQAPSFVTALLVARILVTSAYRVMALAASGPRLWGGSRKPGLKERLSSFAIWTGAKSIPASGLQ